MQNPLRGYDPETGTVVDYDPDEIIYVTAYAISRHYGGPEEGGWWYDWWRPVQTVPAARRDAEQVADGLKARHEDVQQEPYDRFSVLGNGEDLAVVIEDTPGDLETTERPRYE